MVALLETAVLMLIHICKPTDAKRLKNRIVYIHLITILPASESSPSPGAIPDLPGLNDYSLA